MSFDDNASLDNPVRHGNYRWQVVGMLWCISFFNYADRQAVFSVFPLLQTQFHLDNTQLGLLGSSFAWVYGLTAPFAGLIVDRVRRVSAILWGLQTWSAICLATGLSRAFPHLFFFRAAEGLGESAYYPASMSLLSDYHGKATRSRAMGLHQTSVYAGTIAGGYFAGLIGQTYGWRWSFYVFGGLGVLLGFLLRRMLIEPKRGAMEDKPAAPSVSPLRTLRLIFGTKTALCLMTAFLCANFVAVVLLSWMPKFLYDKFAMNLAVAGLTATIFAQLASLCGATIGGWLADRLRARHASGRLIVQMIGLICGAPFVALCGMTGSVTMVIVALTGWGLFKGLYDANIFASLFDVVPAEARGSAAGWMNLIGWLGGGGTAPLLIGIAASSHGLGFSIALASIVYVAGALALLTAILFFVVGDTRRLAQGNP